MPENTEHHRRSSQGGRRRLSQLFRSPKEPGDRGEDNQRSNHTTTGHSRNWSKAWHSPNYLEQRRGYEEAANKTHSSSPAVLKEKRRASVGAAFHTDDSKNGLGTTVQRCEIPSDNLEYLCCRFGRHKIVCDSNNELFKKLTTQFKYLHVYLDSLIYLSEDLPDNGCIVIYDRTFEDKGLSTTSDKNTYLVPYIYKAMPNVSTKDRVADKRNFIQSALLKERPIITWKFNHVPAQIRVSVVSTNFKAPESIVRYKEDPTSFVPWVETWPDVSKFAESDIQVLANPVMTCTIDLSHTGLEGMENSITARSGGYIRKEMIVPPTKGAHRREPAIGILTFQLSYSNTVVKSLPNSEEEAIQMREPLSKSKSSVGSPVARKYRRSSLNLELSHAITVDRGQKSSNITQELLRHPPVKNVPLQRLRG